MSHITIKRARRDGKYPVRIAYEGEPNMFGGRYPAKVSRTCLVVVTLNATSDSIVVNDSGQEFPAVRVRCVECNCWLDDQGRCDSKQCAGEDS